MAFPQKEPLRTLSEQEKRELQRIVKATSERLDVLRRAKAVLAVAGGQAFTQAAHEAGLKSGDGVSKLVKRFNQHGLAALQIAAGRGRKDTYTSAQRARILAEVQRAPDRKAEQTASWSLKTLERTLRKQGLWKLSASTIGEVLALLRPVGEALRTQEDAQVQALWEPAAEDGPVPELPYIERLYIELDGITARLRRGSVPMKPEEHARPGDVYREVKVGAVFTATRGPERSGLAPGVWVDIPCEDSIHYVARRTTSGTFGALLYALAQRQGLSRAQQVVVLGDGAPWIWRQVEEHFPGAVQIVDLWHAQQHVWQVAHAVFRRTSEACTTWAHQACSHLVQGQIEELVTAIAALPAVPPPPGQARSVPEKAVDYFSTNAARMRYPIFRAQGMHVGSGIAEAACKTVVSTRAKRSGMRWTPEGLDAILPLRTAVLNGTYDAFWERQSVVLA